MIKSAFQYIITYRNILKLTDYIEAFEKTLKLDSCIKSEKSGRAFFALKNSRTFSLSLLIQQNRR